jgi:hypothetical protein
MNCDETASANIDLSCFMRCASTGVLLAMGAGSSTPFRSA